MYQEAEFATNIQTGRSSSDFNENQPKHQTGTSYRLFATICDEICLLRSFNLTLDITITKLTEL